MKGDERDKTTKYNKYFWMDLFVYCKRLLLGQLTIFDLGLKMDGSNVSVSVSWF